ncbi:protein saal1-like [Styela clava]
MVERNPSPPHEFEEEQDIFRQDMVADTAISKKWVYQTIVNMCKEVEKQSGDNDTMDIPEDLQDESCRLWDLCVEKQLALFLVEIDATKLLRDVIIDSKSPRLTEITVGVLGNMACTREACSHISNDDELKVAVLSLFSCRDSPTLVEMGRLINTCLADEESRPVWLDLMESSLSQYMDDLGFILNSSSNCDLLKNILQVLDICLDSKPSLISKFSKPNFVNALAEAGLQLSKDDSTIRGLENCLHTLYILTTEESKSKELFIDQSNVFHMASNCCQKWSTMVDFKVGPNPTDVTVASCLAIINFILDISTIDKDSTFFNEVSDDEKVYIADVCHKAKVQCTVSTIDNKDDEYSSTEESKKANLSKKASGGDEISTDSGNNDEKDTSYQNILLLEVVTDLLNSLDRWK